MNEPNALHQIPHFNLVICLHLAVFFCWNDTSTMHNCDARHHRRWWPVWIRFILNLFVSSLPKFKYGPFFFFFHLYACSIPIEVEQCIEWDRNIANISIQTKSMWKRQRRRHTQREREFKWLIVYSHLLCLFSNLCQQGHRCGQFQMDSSINFIKWIDH